MNAKSVAMLMLFQVVVFCAAKYSWDDAGLKGKVKECKQVTSIIHKGLLWNSKKTLSTYIDNYNEKGFKVSSIDYNSDGKIDGKSIYLYNENDQNIEWLYVGKKIVDDLDNKFKIINKYDSKGNMYEATRYSSSGNIELLYKYYYNTKGQIVKKVSYDSNNVIVITDQYKYLDSINIAEHSVLTKYGIEKTVYSYSNNGLLLLETRYSSKSDIESQSEYFYNANIKSYVTSYDATTDKLFREYYQYDSIGNVTNITKYQLVKNRQGGYEEIFNEEIITTYKYY